MANQSHKKPELCSSEEPDFELIEDPELQPWGNAAMQEQLSCEAESSSESVQTLPEMVITAGEESSEESSEEPALTSEVSAPTDEVDDAEVQRIIEDCYANATFDQEPSRTESAWYHALELRKKDGENVNLAAAEHYLYAKYSGKKDGVLGAAATGVMATGYDLVKGGLQLFGQEDLLSTDGTKPSKATVGSTRWGLKGAVDGVSGG